VFVPGRRQEVLDGAVRAIGRTVTGVPSTRRQFAPPASALGLADPGQGVAYEKQAAGTGWGGTTVKAILENESDLGRFRWNQRQWVRDWETGRRIGRDRPESEHKVTERPELAIISAELWADVASRRRAKKVPGSPRPIRKDSQPSAIAPLCDCGVCRGRFSITGKNHGSRALGCSTRRSKGKHGPCPNGHFIQENKVFRFLWAATRATIANFNLEAQVLDGTEKRLAELNAQPKTNAIADLKKAVLRAEGNATRVGDALLRMGTPSEVLFEKLKAAEMDRDRLRAELAQAEKMSDVRTPSPALTREQLKVAVDNLDGLFSEAVQKDPLAIRAALEAMYGRIVLTPKETADGVAWQLSTAVNF
jgi:Recombinase